MGNEILENLVKESRQKLELTQEDVAQAVGVNRTTISRWESGDITNMKIEHVPKLSEVLNLPAIAFIYPETYLNSEYIDHEYLDAARKLQENKISIKSINQFIDLVNDIRLDIFRELR